MDHATSRTPPQPYVAPTAAVAYAGPLPSTYAARARRARRRRIAALTRAA